MSPELERLLAALYERDTCEPKDRARCERTASRLIEDALRQVPDTGRAQFLEAISGRYHEFKRVRKRCFPTLPPKA
jgi:hypothetical protein